jgi:hypothetical protein
MVLSMHQDDDSDNKRAVRLGQEEEEDEGNIVRRHERICDGDGMKIGRISEDREGLK